MENIFKNYQAKLLTQLSLDLNCKTKDFFSRENVITISTLNEGRRSYSPGKPLLEMATLGGNTVITADVVLHDFLQELVRDTEGHRLFEIDNLIKLNKEFKAYGYQMAPTHHMFLPCRDTIIEHRFNVKWLYDDEIIPFYGDQRFPNAIAFPEACPVRPDKIVVLAIRGDTIMGMAGCSEDAPHWQQIGISESSVIPISAEYTVPISISVDPQHWLEI